MDYVSITIPYANVILCITNNSAVADTIVCTKNKQT